MCVYSERAATVSFRSSLCRVNVHTVDRLSVATKYAATKLTSLLMWRSATNTP
jgi:hypothetical protein